MCGIQNRRRELDRINRKNIREEINRLYSYSNSVVVALIEEKLQRISRERIEKYHLDIEGKIVEYIAEYNKLSFENHHNLPKEAKDIYVELFSEMILYLRETIYGLRDKKYRVLVKGWNLQHNLALSTIRYKLANSKEAKEIYRGQIKEKEEEITRNEVDWAILTGIEAAEIASENEIISAKELHAKLKKFRKSRIRAIQENNMRQEDIVKYKRMMGISEEDNKDDK